MDYNIIILAVIFLLSLTLSVFFSGARTAYASLKEVEQLDLKKKPNKRRERIEKLLNNHVPVLLSLKIGLLVANTAIICSAVLISGHFNRLLGLRFEPVLFGMIILMLGILFTINELWALRFVLSKSTYYAELFSFPLMLYYYMMVPVVLPILKIINSIAEKFNLRRNVLDHEKILAIVEDNDENELKEDERAMIHSIIEFGDTEVREIMVPRIDMVCIEENIEFEAFIKLIKERWHSRFPLYQDDVDNILGIIHVKELLSYSTGVDVKEPALKDLARPAHFVPESKKLDDLLREFQKEKHHMAIVVDEYGGTTGLVTLEDVIEEIVGDIQDEYDKEPPLVRKVGDHVYSVDPKIDLHDLNESLEIDLPTEGEYESLAGFILSLTGYVPEVNEVVKHKNYEFIIEKIERNRITRVKMMITPIETEETSV